MFEVRLGKNWLAQTKLIHLRGELTWIRNKLTLYSECLYMFGAQPRGLGSPATHPSKKRPQTVVGLHFGERGYLSSLLSLLDPPSLFTSHPLSLLCYFLQALNMVEMRDFFCVFCDRFQLTRKCFMVMASSKRPSQDIWMQLSIIRFPRHAYFL